MNDFIEDERIKQSLTDISIITLFLLIIVFDSKSISWMQLVILVKLTTKE